MNKVNLVSVFILLFTFSVFGQNKSNKNISEPSGIYALQINVVDMKKAISFYTELLEMEVLTEKYLPEFLPIKNDNFHIILKDCKSLSNWDYNKSSKINLNLYVEDISAYRTKLADAGVRILDDSDLIAGVGKYYRILDPSGNQIDIMELGYEHEAVTKPTFYNISALVIEMEKSREFYENLLGFEVFSESYYPPVIPYKKFGVQLVLHEGAQKRSEAFYPEGSQMIFTLITDDLNKMMQNLNTSGFTSLYDKNVDSFAGRQNAVRDPNGNVVQILQWNNNELDELRRKVSN